MKFHIGCSKIIFFVLTITLIFNNVANAEQIPEWIKNNAKWWNEDKIDEKTFLNGIKYLIENGIIVIEEPIVVTENSKNNQFLNLVPEWIKNNAKWWNEDKIDEKTFLNGIKYLIENGIIVIEDERIETDLVSDFFNVWVYKNDIYLENGVPVSRSFNFELKDGLGDFYQEIGKFGNKDSVVIKPVFTSSAYLEKGFYDYFLEKCESCITAKFYENKELELSVGSQLGKKVLEVLGYEIISDIDVDKNPDILKNYDKVILLHNEYVTKKEFDAITSHPNVIYLYPNALYAEISVNYEDNTMTLVRGHNYPEPEILNGFDWEYDNSPLEYDEYCEDWEFYEISNGWMLNCYPERIIASDVELLKTIKSLGK